MTGTFLMAVAALAGAPGTAEREAPGATARLVEHALALRPAGAQLDSVLFRAEGGSSIDLLSREADGWTLRSFPGLGPQIEAFAVSDFDSDGRPDLLVRRATGSVEVALGDGRIRFVPRERTLPKSAHAHHGDYRAGATLAEAERDGGLALVARRGTLQRLDVPSQAISALELQVDTDASPDTVWVDAEGGVTLVTAGGSGEIARLSADFAPRLVAAGEFGGNPTIPDLLFVGRGARPRVLVLEDLTSTGAVAARKAQPIQKAIVNVFVGQGDFVFSPRDANVQVNDTVHWIWSSTGHNVTSGSDCMPDDQFCSPDNTNCGTTLSNAGATYDRTFPSAGLFPYFCMPHCFLDMTGTVNVQAAPSSPGAVPDGDAVPGTPLLIDRVPGGDLALTWGASACDAATNYALYQGTLPILGGTYDHVALDCNLGDVTSKTITPAAGSVYYLVVPENADAEGSYGLTSAGSEIPRLGGTCRPNQDLGACN